MSEERSRGFPFARIVVVLACTFGVGLGLCGLNAVLSLSGASVGGFGSAMGSLRGVVAIVSLAAMILSALGLVLTVIVWVVVEAFGIGRRGSDPQTLFGDKDDEEPKDPR
jgi:hypothetical protein